jgi:hypothetical protein
MISRGVRMDRPGPRRRGTVRAGPLPYALSAALVVVAAASAAFSFFVLSVLTGAAVGNGNLRGTALVVLLIGVPTLVTAVVATWRGATRGLVVWLGTLGYLLYQAVLFCFATPLNGLFLCYVAYLGLAVWSIVALVPAVDLHVFGSRVSGACACPVRRRVRVRYSRDERRRLARHDRPGPAAVAP